MCNISAIGDHFQLRRNSQLRKLQLSSIQLIISSLLLNQIRMIPAFNDLSMIEYAGLGVAMENAQPVVKESADFITKSNDEDGILHVVNLYMRD